MKTHKMQDGGVRVGLLTYPSKEAAIEILQSYINAPLEEEKIEGLKTPSPYFREERVVETPHKGYYKSFGSRFASDEYVETQAEKSYIRKINIPLALTATESEKEDAKIRLRSLNQIDD